MVAISKFFKAWLFELRLRRAIKKADRLRNRYSRKFFVINLCGRPMVVSKRHIQHLAATGTYKPGVTARDIARVALYKTR